MRRISSDRTVKCRLYITTDGMLKVLSLLSTGFLKYVVVCSTSRAMLDADQVMRSLNTYVRCCVPSFSVSCVSSDLKDMVVRCVSVIGCGYFYDATDPRGYLVNASGILMRKINNDIYEVK